MIDKPSDKEQEYFLRKEAERLKALREEHRQKLAEQERVKMKELHFMHCAKCGQTMTTTTLEGVEVEICSDCGGIYLDAGELDRMLAVRRGSFGDALTRLRKLLGT